MIYQGWPSPQKETTVNENKGELLLKIKTKEYYGIEDTMKLVKNRKMDGGDSLKHIIYVKYKEEENMKKPLLAMIEEEKIPEITTIEENGYDGVSKGRTYL